MNLTATQRRVIERFINAVETGDPDGDYGAISIYRDGKNGAVKQLTLGRAQTTEAGGNVAQLLNDFISADEDETFDAGLQLYFKHDRYDLAAQSKDNADLKAFKAAFRAAGRDSDMREVQDAFFERRYWSRAFKFAQGNGFVEPLTMLIVYDSYIHSGSIPMFLRRRFREGPEDERAWVKAYLLTRHQWLKHHSRPLLRKTIYRTKAMLCLVERGDWKLASRPIRVNGILVA